MNDNENKERILLDATLKCVICEHAFKAELANGHQFVAFLEKANRGRVRLNVGNQVKVEMSPYDMSKGRILIKQGQKNESKSVGQTNL